MQESGRVLLEYIPGASHYMSTTADHSVSLMTRPIPCYICVDAGQLIYLTYSPTYSMDFSNCSLMALFYQLIHLHYMNIMAHLMECSLLLG